MRRVPGVKRGVWMAAEVRGEIEGSLTLEANLERCSMSN